MATSRWVYSLATGEFLRGGFSEEYFNPETEGLVEFPDASPHPDRRIERYDAATGKRSATPEEVAAYDAQHSDETATALYDRDPRFQAMLRTQLRGRLGRPATAQEIAAERAVYIGILKQIIQNG